MRPLLPGIAPTSPIPILCSLFAFTAAGCAIQETTGFGAVSQSAPVVTETFAATMHALRASNGVIGVRAGTVLDDGFVVKNGIVHGGYDIRVVPGHLVLEPGLDLGVGDPLTHKFDGLGAYAGASGTARLRLAGMDDSEPSFTVVGLVWELVLMPRGGGWMPPEGARTHAVYGEYAVELGFRLAFASDVFTPVQGRVSEGDDSGSKP